MTEPTPQSDAVTWRTFGEYREIQVPITPELASQDERPGELAREELLDEFVPHVEPIDEPTPHRPWPFGLIAFAIAVLLVVAEIAALSLANAGKFEPATILGQLLIALTVLPLVFGVLAIIRRRGLGFAIAAIVVAVLANPFIQVSLFAFFGPVR